MSYCVNCGVELDASEKKCPLCSTPVYNPREDAERKAAPYPLYFENDMKRLNRKFWGRIAALILLIPVLVTVICNVFISKTLSWSLYVAGACALVYVLAVFPFRMKKKKPYLYIVCDTAATLLYVLLIAALTDGFYWYFYLALPVIFCFYAYIAALVTITGNKKTTRLIKASLIITATGLLTVFIDLVTSLYVKAGYFLSWSLIVFGVCVIFSVICALFNRHKLWAEEFKKRLFI